MPKKGVIECPYSELKENELKQAEKDDLHLAKDVRDEAGADRTDFAVGAVIRTNDGKVWTGWNVENMIQDGLHAEIGALGSIVKESRDAGIKRIVVVGGSIDEESDEIIFPCGGCAQKLLEYAGDPEKTDILAAGSSIVHIVRTKLKHLLPFSFMPKVLSK
jgi:cytidine deaminase